MYSRIIILVLIDAEGAEAARLSHLAPSTTEVGVVQVVRGDFELELISNGKLEAQRRAVVPFAVQEQILSVSVREGQRVSAGQTLGKAEFFHPNVPARQPGIERD